MTRQVQIARELGQTLRAARIANELTLTQLAQRTGLSEAFLSRLERAQAAASVANLIQITDALGIGMHELFARDTRVQKTNVAVHRGPGDSPLVQAEGYRWRRLGGGAPRDQLGAFLLIFPKGGKMPVSVSHAGQEYCAVLAGEVDFHVGKEVHRLRAGDGIFLSSTLPHHVANIGKGEAQLLMTAAHEAHDTGGAEWWEPGIAGPGMKAKKRKTMEDIL